MGKKSLIEINGRIYDTSSGHLLVEQTPTKTVNPKNIDGFMRSPKKASNVHKQPEKSKTLHRATTKKKSKKLTTTVSRSTEKEPSVQSKRQLSKSIKPERAHKAAKSSRSNKISKFHHVQDQAPQASASTNDAAEFDTQLSEVFEPPAHLMNPVRRKHPEPTANQPKEFKKRVAWLAWIKRIKPAPLFATSLAATLVVGYFVYLNIPNFALRIAASRAGFEASLPAYKPSGFGLDGPISYSKGQITLRYDTSSDDREFKIVQRQSSWDSLSLQANYVALQSTDFLTFNERGLTIYVFNGSNATWVDGGIWYTIEGDSKLDSSQLVRIASSL